MDERDSCGALKSSNKQTSEKFAWGKQAKHLFRESSPLFSAPQFPKGHRQLKTRVFLPTLSLSLPSGLQGPVHPPEIP